MDKKTQSEEVFKDITREELIAISNSLPEKVLNSEGGCEPISIEDKSTANKIEDKSTANNVDGVEKIISELISISYWPPDGSVTPPPPIVTPELGNHV